MVVGNGVNYRWRGAFTSQEVNELQLMPSTRESFQSRSGTGKTSLPNTAWVG